MKWHSKFTEFEWYILFNLHGDFTIVGYKGDGWETEDLIYAS